MEPLGRDAVRERAKLWLSRRLAIVDLETTGLGQKAEPIEIAVVDENGQTLLESLVSPTIPITQGATDKHGMVDADVVEAPTMVDPAACAATVHWSVLAVLQLRV